MGVLYRIGIVAALSLAIGLGGNSVAEAKPASINVVVRVVDQFGDPQYPANVIACSLDCANPAAGVAVNAGGVGRLVLDPNREYNLLAFVQNPNPAWACPGFPVGDNMLYIAPEQVGGLGRDIPKTVTFTIAEPSPLDCIPIPVTTDSGVPLPTAAVFTCGHLPGSDECIDRPFGGPGGDGVIRLDVDPSLEYRLQPFVTDTGWPCPSFVVNGVSFYVGTETNFTVDELLAGVHLVIPVPDALNCVEVHLVDAAGDPFPNAGLIVCGHAEGAPCENTEFAGSGADGVVRLESDPDLVYDLTAFVGDQDWPGGFPTDTGPIWFGEGGTFSPTELVNGITLEIVEPDPDSC